MLALHARLRFGAYDAGAETDPRVAEWPPHPARLFCALVASDPTDAEWSALRWLEAQAPPVVECARLLGTSSDEIFVPTNEVDAKSPSLPGRRNAGRRKPRALPSRSSFRLLWPDATPEDSVRAALDALAARVPYVGRSTASTEVWFETADLGRAADDERYEPVPGGGVDLRVPWSGYADRLQELHERGARAWEASRTTTYRRKGDEPEVDDAEPVDGPFGRLLTFHFERPVHLHSSMTVAVTNLLRTTVMSILDDPVPPAVAGHGHDHTTHVAFLGLPNVGVPPALPDGPALAAMNPRPDGRLLALALALPGDDDALARDLYAALVLDRTGRGPLAELRLQSTDEPIGLAHDPTASVPLGARPTTWTEPSTLWATATPVVADRFPKGRAPAALVAEALINAGYPAPAEVVAHRAPVLPGAPQLTRSSVQRRAGVPVKPWYHAWVRFERPVRGPVLAGSMRYRGLGLFRPVRSAPTGPGPTGDAQR